MTTAPPDLDFTVGWICAIQAELDAARKIIDNEFGVQRGEYHDENIYILAHIGWHNVVITCLPMGRVGTNTAATVAARMMDRFRNIKVGLLVGIGGGLPSEINDIRLGDVVVSRPDGQYGGVVQYDMGKWTSAGFERTGSLNSPPENVLAILNLMPHHGSRVLSCPLEPYPGDEFDALLDASNEQPVERSPGMRWDGPHVFYGTVASGNKVVRNAARREILVKKHRVLCCEMEAAGLMNQSFPCLVIRGIADYADAQKNDIWHKYAAAAAAGYAKDFLGQMPGDIVREPEPGQVSNGQEYITDAENNTCTWLLRDEVFLEWQRQTNGLLWLTGSPGAGKSTLLKSIILDQTHQESENVNTTCFLSFFFHGHSEEPRNSVQDFHQSLLHQLLRRNTGLASTDVTQKFQKSHQGRLASKAPLYPNDLEQLLQDCIQTILKSTSVQIMVDALDECSNVDNLEAFLKKTRSRWTPDLFPLRICITCRHFPLVKWQDGTEVSVELRNSNDIRTYIRNHLEQFAHGNENDRQALENEMVDRSSGIFLWAKLVCPLIVKEQRQGLNPVQVLQSLKRLPSELQKTFHQVLFQVVHDHSTEPDSTQIICLFQWLCFARRPLSVVELQWAMNMSTCDSSPSLQRCLARSESIRSEKQMILRLKSLSGGLAEFRPYHGVKMARLIHQSIKDYLLGEGFQLLDKSLKSALMVIGQSHALLSRACIRYLAMEEVVERRGNLLRHEFPFMDYAMMAWIDHAEKAEVLRVSSKYVLEYFKWPSNRVTQSWVRMTAQHGRFKHWLVPKTTLLHVTARHGLTGAVEAQLWSADLLCKSLAHLILRAWFLPSMTRTLLQTLLYATYAKTEHSPGQKDNHGRTPLSLAASRGHTHAVHLLLLRSDTDVNSMDNDGRTALSWASAAGHQDVVRLLLQRQDIEVDCLDKLGRTSLSYAVANGNEAVAHHIICKAGNVTFADHIGDTALHCAARFGHLMLAKLMMERGANVLVKDKRGRSPLHEAVLYGKFEMVDLLLRAGADMTAQDNGGDTVFHRAAGNRDPMVARRLSVKESDLETVMELLLFQYDGVKLCHKTDNSGSTPLHRAARNGRLIVARMLMENMSNANALDQQGRTPLQVAIQNGERAMVRLLSENEGCVVSLLIEDETIDEVDLMERIFKNPPTFLDGKKTSFYQAAELGDEGTMRKLLEKGDAVTLEALNVTSKRGQYALVQLLLAKKPNLARKQREMLQGRFCQNVSLRYAMDSGNVILIDLLLTHGATLAMGHSLMDYAAKTGHVDVVKSMLARDASFGKLSLDTALHFAAGKSIPPEGPLDVSSAYLDEGPHEEVIRILLDHGADVNSSFDGKTPLERVARHGNEAMVRLLLERGAAVFPETLESAAFKGSVRLMGLLLQQGVATTGKTVQVTAQQTSETVTNILLEHGASMSSRALNVAAQHSNEPVFRLLLDMGVSATSETLLTAAAGGSTAIVTLLVDQGFETGPKVLEKAAESGCSELCRLLLEKGAYSSPMALEAAAVSGNVATVRALLAKGVGVTAEAVEAAASRGHVEMIQVLLEVLPEREEEHRASSEASQALSRTEEKATATCRVNCSKQDMSRAVVRAVRRGHTDAARLLVSAGIRASSQALIFALEKGNVDLIRLFAESPLSGRLSRTDFIRYYHLLDELNLTELFYKDFSLSQALMIAARVGNEGKVVNLVNQGALVNRECLWDKFTQQTPLNMAAMARHTGIIKILLAHGADMKAMSRNKGSALHIAAAIGNVAMVQLLIDEGADFDLMHPLEGTPLTAAAKNGSFDVVKMLLEEGADPDASHVYTRLTKAPLFAAAEYGHEKVVQLLLENGANAKKIIEGQTALDWAMRFGQEDAAFLLKRSVEGII